MRIGVLTVLYSQMNFTDVLDKVKEMGISAVEIGTGGYPGDAHLKLGDAVHHVHGKDCYIDPLNTSINGCNDHTPYDQIKDCSGTFRTVGYGHDLKFWKDFVSALRLIGYDHVISIEHEDALMSTDEGLKKAISVLREAVLTEKPGEMYWA